MVTLARRDDMNLESIIFKAHAIRFLQCTSTSELHSTSWKQIETTAGLTSKRQFLMSCKEDFNNQRPLKNGLFAGLHGCSTSKNPAMNAMFTMSEHAYTRIFCQDLAMGTSSYPPCCNTKNNRGSASLGRHTATTQVVRLTTAHLEDEMHRRFLLHLVRISRKMHQWKIPNKDIQWTRSQIKSRALENQLSFFCPPSFQSLC